MEEKIRQWFSSGLPFVVYRKPDEHTMQGWFQDTNRLYLTGHLDKSCFVLAPFSGTELVVLYPEHCSYLQEPHTDKDVYEAKPTLHADDEARKQHITLVGKAIEEIHRGKIVKVVLSRRERVGLDSSLLQEYFNRFLNKYPTAFVYWYFHPKVGMWMGATPEQLLKTEHDILRTVALAGTMPDSGAGLDQVVWGNKEKEEQQVVTDYIINSLKPFTSAIRQTEPFTYKAGSLLHIKTDIEAVLAPSEKAYDVIHSLHPTPALCGFPKEKARKFITENEGYDREYYGGYIGEWCLKNGAVAPYSDLFVNLRCMKIEGNDGYLYLGGGINKDSDPEKEYDETVNKSKTVKSIL